MSQEHSNSYWHSSYKTYYEAYYHELTSEALIARWQRIDFLVIIFVAATASGSTLSGLALWNKPGWMGLWAVIAGTVSLSSFAHGTVKVPERLKEQEERRRLFAGLRIDVETFREQLESGLTPEEAQKQYLEFRRRFKEYTNNLKPDIAATKSLGLRVQEKLNERFKEYVQ